MSRIDYIFISRHLAYLVEKSDIGVNALSDHAPVSLEMQPPRPLKRTIYWKLNRLLLLDDNFIKLLEEQTDLYLNINDKEDTDPRTVWGAYKAYMRGGIILYTSSKKKERLRLQNYLEIKIKRLDEEYYTTKSDEVSKELKTSRDMLSDLLTRKAEKDMLFAQQRLPEFGNKPNKFLARLANNAHPKFFITAVKDENGQRHTDNKYINERFRQFYEELYSSETDCGGLKDSNFLNSLNIPQLTEDQANLLEGPITLLEIDTAISSLQLGKSPGADGYPVEFFKILKGKLNKLLQKVHIF